MKTLNFNQSLPQYRPDIDGLRAIAILSVVVFHAFPNLLPGGFIGVDIFFVISGFLISKILIEGIDQGKFSFIDFYIRRIRRIAPALCAVLFFCLLVGCLILLPEELTQLGWHVMAGAGFVSNFILWSESGYFDNPSNTKPLLHLWSLGIEEQFYIFWPIALWLTTKLKIKTPLLIGFSLVTSLGFNLFETYQDPIAAFYSPATRFWELLCGSMLAWHTLKHPVTPQQSAFITPSKPTLKQHLLSGLGAGFLAVGFVLIKKNSSFPGYWAILPTIGTCLIIMSGPQSFINQRLLAKKALVWLGIISFPLYLWHWPLISFGQIIYSGEAPAQFMLLAITTSIVASWLTVQYIENRFRSTRKISSKKIKYLCLTLALMATLGKITQEISAPIPGTLYTESGTINLSASPHLPEQPHSTYIQTATNFIYKALEYKSVLSSKIRGQHTIGDSDQWFRGKDDWLFLGNHHHNTIAKLKLSKEPNPAFVEITRNEFKQIADIAASANTKTILFFAQDKTSIYPEYLPDILKPSVRKYSDIFLTKLQKIPNLVLYNPTQKLIDAKASQGILYWKTDSHWNAKGAYIAYAGFCDQLGLPKPHVSFTRGQARRGDILPLTRFKEFPLHPEDNWDVQWQISPSFDEKALPYTTDQFLSRNPTPLSNQYVWVIGDSFANGLKPYLNATFKEVRYIGHPRHLADAPETFLKAQKKPDLIIIVKVERSF